jgi:glutathione S-transferase
MKLLWSSRSPFVRKVMIAAHETGLADRIERVRTLVSPVKPNAEVMALNPLNKLPTLILDDGRAVYDSRVICEHLDGLHAGPRLFPAAGRARLEALRLQALGDGILDFLLIGLSERLRPEAQQSPELKAALELKFQAAFDALEREAPALAADPLTIGHIAIGCVAGYADFRYAAKDWRRGRPQLAAWHRAFADRPSCKATEHAEVY